MIETWLDCSLCIYTHTCTHHTHTHILTHTTLLPLHKHYILLVVCSEILSILVVYFSNLMAYFTTDSCQDFHIQLQMS